MLIVSYYWPPLGGPGSLRPVKFAKYFPAFGIEPLILTRKDIAYHTIDHELGDDVRNVTVIRTESFDPPRILHLLGMKRYRPRVWQRPFKYGLNFPDHKIMWLPFACGAAKRLDFKHVFVTAPPFSAFLAGYAIARKAGRPLILDFRDAWLENPFLPYKGWLQKNFVAYWERKLVKCASLITVVDENIRTSLLKKYPESRGKIHVLPNTIDPDDFVAVAKDKKFTLSYLGTIREERNPEPLLKAVQRAIDAGQIDKGDINVTFIGHVEERYLSLINAYPFTETTGHLPYRQAMKLFAAAHAGIMITRGGAFFFPSRQNEYLASRLPILVCGKSEGTHVLRNAFAAGYPGWIYDYEDVEGMQQKISELYIAQKKGCLPVGPTDQVQYTRKDLTGQLAALIEKLRPCDISY